MPAFRWRIPRLTIPQPAKYDAVLTFGGWRRTLGARGLEKGRFGCRRLRGGGLGGGWLGGGGGCLCGGGLGGDRLGSGRLDGGRLGGGWIGSDA